MSVSAYVTELSLSPSVGLSVGLSGKSTVAKRLSGSGCRWDGEWGRSMDGCRRGGDRRMGRGWFEGESGASHCNQWGLRCIVVWKCMN